MDEPTNPPTTPRTNSIRLGRDDRTRILTLRSGGYTYGQIVDHLPGITYRQVQYTCQSGIYTPRKARGQPPKLSDAEVDDIINFIISSKRTRRLPYDKVTQELSLSIS
jgi:hypothetical protein